MSTTLRTIVVVVFGVLLARTFAQEDLSDFFDAEPIETAEPNSPPTVGDLPLKIVDSNDDLDADMGASDEDFFGSETSPTTDVADDLQTDLATDSKPNGLPESDLRDDTDTTEPDLDAILEDDLDLGVEPADETRKKKGPLFGDSIRSRSVVLDERNGFDGAIGSLVRGRSDLVPTTGLSIELFDSKSRRIRDIATDANGRFRVEGISSGVYQFVARGESGFLAFSLVVADQGAGKGLGQIDQQELFLVQMPMGTRDSIDVIAAAVPPTFEEVNSIVKLHYGVALPMYMLRAGTPAVDANVPVPANPLSSESPISKSALRTYEVPLRKGNRIQGRLVKYDSETGTPIGASKVYVHIIRNDKAVGLPIRVNRNGEFEAELPDGPGAYSIVVAGKGGFGAAGFYAYAPDELEANATRNERTFLVSTQLDEADDTADQDVDIEFNDPLIDEMESDRDDRNDLDEDLDLPGLLRRAIGGGGAGGGGGWEFAICDNDVIVPNQGGVGNGNGAAAGAGGGGAGDGGGAAGFGIGGGNGFAPPVDFAPPGFPMISSSSFPVFGGDATGFGGGFGGGTGVGGGGFGGRGLAPLLIGGGVAAAIAISADDDDRRQVSPFSP